MRRVVITGIGVVTPLGVGSVPFWGNSLRGEPAIGRITRFDTSPFRCRVAGEVVDFRAEDHLDPKVIRQTDRSTQMAMVASALAADDAGLELDRTDSSRVGMFFANLFGGMEFAEPELHESSFHDPNRVSAYQSIAWFYAAAQGQWSIARGIRGYGKSLVADRAGGLQAVGWGMQAIRLGHCDVAFAGGFEAPLVPFVYLIHESSGVMAEPGEGDEAAFRPFDARRSGLVLAEGAAILLLEWREHARSRGATILAEVAGFDVNRAESVEASGPEADEGAVAALSRCFVGALHDARIAPPLVKLYCADGAARPREDHEELAALAAVFGPERRLPVSVPKALTGNSLGAAGALDVAWAALMLDRATLLPTPNLDEPDASDAADFVVGRPRAAVIDSALCCGRGYGGLNAAIVLTHPELD